MEVGYKQAKTCADCGHENVRWLSEEWAAFEERRRLSDWECANGDPEQLPLLLEFVDRPELSDDKRGSLLSALMVIAHDLIEEPGEPSKEDAALLERVLAEIDRRFDRIEAARQQHFVMTYLCRTVYPRLSGNVDVL